MPRPTGNDEREPASARDSTSDEISIKDLQVVKALAERLGSQKFRSLIDLLAPVPGRKEGKGPTASNR